MLYENNSFRAIPLIIQFLADAIFFYFFYIFSSTFFLTSSEFLIIVAISCFIFSNKLLKEFKNNFGAIFIFYNGINSSMFSIIFSDFDKVFICSINSSLISNKVEFNTVSNSSLLTLNSSFLMSSNEALNLSKFSLSSRARLNFLFLEYSLQKQLLLPSHQVHL